MYVVPTICFCKRGLSHCAFVGLLMLVAQSTKITMSCLLGESWGQLGSCMRHCRQLNKNYAETLRRENATLVRGPPPVCNRRGRRRFHLFWLNLYFSVTVIVASSAALSSLKNGLLSPCSRAGWRRVFFLLMSCIFIFLIEFLPRHGTRCQFKHAVDVDESAELEKCKTCTKPLSPPVWAFQLCGKCCSEECNTHNPIPKAILGEWMVHHIYIYLFILHIMYHILYFIYYRLHMFEKYIYIYIYTYTYIERDIITPVGALIHVRPSAGIVLLHFLSQQLPHSWYWGQMLHYLFSFVVF